MATMSDGQFLRKRRFSLSGYGLMEYNEIYNYMKHYIYDQGYVPIYGTEEFTTNGGEWDYVCYGMERADPDIEYVTAEGYFKWRTTQDKS